MGRVHEVLRPGGAFVNAEQVAAPRPQLTEVYAARWTADCRALGASESEIDGARERMRLDRCADVESQLGLVARRGLSHRRLPLQGVALRGHRRLPGGVMVPTMDWDAATYDRISAPQQRWAGEQLDALTLRGDEIVCDAGCGSGRVTRELADRLPGGTVYAVDVAPSMAAHTEAVLGDHPCGARGRVVVLCQDLAQLSLPQAVDVIFSNATFHWVPDHPALFAALHRNLRPGGRLVAQCGGAQNIESVRVAAEAVIASEPFTAHFDGWRRPWTYATARQTADRLTRAGFEDVQTWLTDRPTAMEDGREFVANVCLVRHLDPLPAPLHDPFIDAVMALLPVPLTLDYVRLNMTARREA